MVKIESTPERNSRGELIKHLVIDSIPIMTNDDIEYKDIEEDIKYAYGDCYVAGLGLSCLINELEKKESVKTITCVEIDKRVLEICKCYIKASKCKVFIGNGLRQFNINPEIKEYNYIFIDTYFDPLSDGIKHIEEALHYFPSFLSEGGVFEAWKKEQIFSEIKKVNDYKSKICEAVEQNNQKVYQQNPQGFK